MHDRRGRPMYVGDSVRLSDDWLNRYGDIVATLARASNGGVSGGRINQNVVIVESQEQLPVGSVLVRFVDGADGRAHKLRVSDKYVLVPTALAIANAVLVGQEDKAI